MLERDPCGEARRQGYGVTLSETNAALDGLGILQDLRARNTRSCAHWTFHSSGRVLGYYGAAFLPEERRAPSPWTNLRVPRNEVREVLLSRLEPGTVRFGRRAVGYSERPDEGHVDVDVEIVEPTASPPGAIIGGGAGRPEWSDRDDSRAEAEAKAAADADADADATTTMTTTTTERSNWHLMRDMCKSTTGKMPQKRTISTAIPDAHQG